jgi:hypothetical protein
MTLSKTKYRSDLTKFTYLMMMKRTFIGREVFQACIHRQETYKIGETREEATTP